MKKQADFRRNHMLTRWIITGCIVVMIPVLCSFILFLVNKKVLEQKMAQVNGFIVEDIRHNIDDRLKEIINIANSIYLDIDFSEARLNTDEELLFRSRIASCFQKLQTYGIANAEADVLIYLPKKDFLLTTAAGDDFRYLYGTLKRQGKIESSQEEWREQILSAPANMVLMAENLSYRNYGKKNLTYVVRSSIGHEERASVISVSIDTDFITNAIENEKSYPCTVLIVDREGRMVADYGEPLADPGGLHWEEGSTEDREGKTTFQNTGNDTLFYFRNGETAYAATSLSSEICAWRYIVCTPKEEYISEIQTNMVINMGILFLGMGLALLSMTLVQRHNYKPVRTLHRENLSMRNTLNSQKEQEKEWSVLKLLRDYGAGTHKESLAVLADWKADTAVWLPVTVGMWQEGEAAEEEEISLLTFAVRNVAAELLGERYRYLTTSDRGFLIYLFVIEQKDVGECVMYCRESMSKLCGFFWENFHVELLVTMGEPLLEEMEVPEGYARLMEASRLRNREPVFGVRDMADFYRDPDEKVSQEISEAEAGGLSEEIKEYVRENYADNNLNISAIAQHFGLSARYLSRLFKDAVGLGLIDYINQVRVRQAETLLKTTFKTVDEIAEEVGYTNSRSFRRNFHKITGKNAASYKRINRS